MPIIPINSKFSLRFFTRVETANDCFRIFDIGIQSVDPKSDTPRVDSIVLPGYASQFHRTRPVSEIKADADKATASDSSPSEKTEGDTAVTPVDTEVVPSTESTSVDTEDEAHPSPEVETPEETTRRKAEEVLDQEDDYTGHTFS